MGLADIVPDEAQEKSHRYYPDHDKQDEIEQVMEETIEELSGDLDIEFIEVSPQMTSKATGRAFKDDDRGIYYIRLKEDAVEKYPWYYVKRTIMHEVVHIWCWQNGYDLSDSDPLFNWILGHIGAGVTGLGPHHENYEVVREFEEI